MVYFYMNKFLWQESVLNIFFFLFLLSAKNEKNAHNQARINAIFYKPLIIFTVLHICSPEEEIHYVKINCTQKLLFININFLTLQLLATETKNLPQANTETWTSSRIESFKQSLSTKGFLRSQKPYTPPADVETKLRKIVETTFHKELAWDTELQDAIIRFQLFSSCFKEFQHGIPNSMLHTFETLGNGSYNCTPSAKDYKFICWHFFRHNFE